MIIDDGAHMLRYLEKYFFEETDKTRKGNVFSVSDSIPEVLIFIYAISSLMMSDVFRRMVIMVKMLF